MKSLKNTINESMILEGATIDSEKNWLKTKEAHYKMLISHVQKINHLAIEGIKILKKEFPDIFTDFQIADTDMSSFWVIFNTTNYKNKQLYSNEIKDLEQQLDRNSLISKHFDIVGTSWSDSFRDKAQFALRLKD
jgi:hypothetical protein